MKDLLTRQEVIDTWTITTTFSDRFCCPYCRDLLRLTDNNTLMCNNYMCKNGNQYTLDGSMIIKETI